MTTDPFTEAAYTNAQEQYPGPTGSRRGGRSLALYQQRAHVEGWEAARTHLAAQEPTDAEAVAYLAAFVEDLPPGAGDEWTPDTIARVKRGLRAARRDKEAR